MVIIIMPHYSHPHALVAVPHVDPKIGKSSWQPLPLKFRPKTTDIDIFKNVVDKNEYRLPDTLDSNDIIIDIGAHIGCFTYACLKRGTKRIYSYETSKDNYDIAKYNFENETRSGIVKLYNLAVWRSDIYQDKLYYLEHYNSTNTGGGSVTCDALKGVQINAIQFDKIIDDITNSINRIKLVKLDCESSEFPILFTSKKLSLIDYICGEYHFTILRNSDNINGNVYFDGEDIKYYLDSQGFSTIIISHSESLGLFFAKRKGLGNFFKDMEIP